MIAEICNFCPTCNNYAVTGMQIKRSKSDFMCSRCGLSKLSQHYAAGSVAHRLNCNDWRRGARTTINGVAVLPPPPWPEK